MRMIVIISLLVAGNVVMAAPAAEECPRILAHAGVTDNFAGMVAHTIHSLSLEDIRYYFKSDATEENGIPTVNLDLDAEERVLPNAPLAGYDEDFSTMGLKSFDMVMRNMNRTGHYQTRDDNILVQIAHVLHMAELWEKVAESYKNIARLLDPESDICACVTDIENNDILNYLNLIAFKLRYPGITSGNHTLTDRYLSPRTKRSKAAGSGFGYKVSFGYKVMRSAQFDMVNFDLSDLELLKDVAEILEDGDDPTAPVALDSAEHWTWWRDMVKSLSMGEEGYYDIAVFMFCMLN